MDSFSREDFILMVSRSGSIKNKNFTQIDLSGLYLSNLKFENCIFNEGSFERTSLNSIYFESCSFKRCKFISSTLEDVYFFRHCKLDEAIIKNSNFEHLVSRVTIAPKLKIINTKFRNSNFIHASHQGSFLKNVTFDKSFFQMVFLDSSVLDNIKISNSDIQNMDVDGCDIKNKFLIEFCLYTGLDVKIFREMGIEIKKIFRE